MKQSIEINTGNEEVWLPVPGLENQLIVSNLGRVKTCVKRVRTGSKSTTFRTINECIKKQVLNKNGYLYITYSINDKVYGSAVHRLVAKTFVSNPEDKKEVNHIDGNKTNNEDWNLEWLTAKENTHHFLQGERKKSGIFFNIEDINAIRELSSKGKTNKEISEVYKVRKEVIRRIITKETWNF